MRVSEMWRLVDEEFGRAYGRHLARSQIIPSLADRSVEQALSAGVSPREAWLALCREQQVPPERWLGQDPPVRRPPVD